MSAALVIFGSFFILLFLGVPIALSLGLSSIITLLYENLPLSIIPANMYSATGKFVLLAIPFFILGGNIMEKSGISGKLIDFARTLVGHRKSGMALVCIIVACFFAAISGSGPATVAALGAILIPAMTDVGYEKSSSTALMSTAGAIGIVIPPSITFVIYGSITGNSVGQLFAAGIIPGILMGAILVVAMQIISRKWDIRILPKSTGKERWAAFKDAFWGLMMPVIILGGIYGGIFTPTEAAAVSALYGLIVGFFVYRSLNLKSLMEILKDSVSQTAVVMFIVGSASLFSWVLTVTGVASSASSALINLVGDNKLAFLLIVNIILLIAGMFIDANSAMYIILPILYPVAMTLGVNPIHLGAVMVLNMAIGLVTPPVGINLYTGCGIAHISLKDISKAVIPFVLASIVVLLIVTYVPILSTWLPSLITE